MAGGEIRFGFLGAGWIAHRALGPAVHTATGARLQAAAARDPDRAAALNPAGGCYSDYRTLVEDPDVDVVYISLSNESHRPWAIAALRAGKHVLCEKPLGLDADEVAEMVSVAKDRDLLLVEALWYRWHPRTRRLEQLLAESAIGTVHDVEADFSFAGDFEGERRGNFRLDPLRGGGALYDVGCYSVSAALLALGDRIRVERAESLPGPTGVDLATAAWLVRDDAAAERARAVVRCGIDLPDRQVLQVVGSAGRIEFESGEAFTVWHQPSSLRITPQHGPARSEIFEPVDAYRLMVEAVAARVRGEDAFLIEPEQSVALAVSLDAIRAAATPVPMLEPPL